jgi:D-sedoheptulose 7-phosphate isomerase
MEKVMNLSFSDRLSNFKSVLADVRLTDSAALDLSIESGLQDVYLSLSKLRDVSGSLYIIGNGGSAGVASHASTDFFNVAKIKTFTLHESSLLTCMTNDFGYENAFARMLDQVINKNDLLIAISSSGNSINIRNAVDIAKKHHANIITLSGFSEDNPLRRMGNINIWLNSYDYGFVEIGHQFLLHNIADRFNPKFNNET